MTEKLHHLLKITSSNNFEFTFQKEGDNNYIMYSLSPNSIIVNIVNPDDLNLNQLLDDKIEELQKLFK
jgi:hypothetical protein